MTTTIHTSHSTGWTGVTSTSGTTMYSSSGQLSWSLSLIRPGHAHRITLHAYSYSPAGTVNILIQGRAYTIPTYTWRTITHDVDPERPLTVNVAATRLDATVTVEALEDLPDNPIPADVLALEALLPIPTAAMRWDLSRWDRSAWQTTRPIPGTLIWNEGRWDQTYWEDQTLTTTWTDILGPCTRVSTIRGVASTGPVLAARAGTLALEATDDLNPRQLGLVYGTPIRLYHWPTATLIWAGNVSDVSTTPSKTGKGSTAIQAVDLVATIVNTTRYGARPDGGGNEVWSRRLARLATSLPQGTTYQTVINDASTPIVPTVWETTLANHLDALVASTGGAWCANRDGTSISVWASLPTGAPEIALTDNYDDKNAAQTVWYYTAGPSTWTASNVIAGIDATTHPASLDDTGEWHADDETTTVTDDTTTQSWGGSIIDVDVLTIPGNPTRDAARRLLKRATDAPTLTGATLYPKSSRIHDGGRLMTEASHIDPLTPVIAIQSGERSTALIASIHHDITPETWKTSLELTPKG
ncbi:hypothetical protein [Schaalia sp. ZJ1691]|uniref:hypothetical protein n=1 Tax=Schaalia sp. ZJ1691 TaxID=2709404 RepID=UPI0013ED02C1|nr:hypothetical protein [Schaalia sp. ZJ1691]